MAIILALEKLYTDTIAQFGEDAQFGTPVNPVTHLPDPFYGATRANVFGWREPSRQGGPAARIVWMPGDPGGNLGAFTAPKYPGRIDIGRPLVGLDELFTVWLSNADDTQPNNELAQWKAARLLYDAWMRAIYLVAHGTFKIVSQAWEIAKNERRYGATLRIVGAIQAVIPDTVPTLVPIDTGANVTYTELDASESDRIDSTIQLLSDDSLNVLEDDAGEELTT